MSIDDLKQRLADVPGIETLTMQTLVGRQVFGFAGLIAGVDLHATDQDIEDAIRSAAHTHTSFRSSPGVLRGLCPSGEIEPSVMLASAPGDAIPATPLPAVNLTEPISMTAPSPGSFAASIRAMMDEARAGVAQARTDGLAKVGEAVGKLNDAKIATAKVSDTMAKTIEDEAASVLSELGQISNDLGAS